MTLLAFEQVGGAQRCLEMSVEYAKERMQFGRPIGSFQAIKHKAADVLLDLESERYFGLDPVGTRIWALLGEGASIGAVVETLAGAKIVVVAELLLL